MASRIRGLFQKYPFLVNSVTLGSIFITAEGSQQFIKKKILTQPPEKLDKGLIARFGVITGFVWPPLLYKWYKWLDSTLPGTTKTVVVKKILLDRLVMAPCMFVIFFTGMSLMEGAHDPFAALREKFVATISGSFMFWAPAQAINFFWVPPKFRLVYVGACSFLWANVLCLIQRQKSTPVRGIPSRVRFNRELWIKNPLNVNTS